jgi:hypothetical protein
MKTLSFAVVAAALVLGGCKSNSVDGVDDKMANAEQSGEVSHQAKVDQNVKDKGIKCRSEAPTGSRIAKMKCTTREQRRARKSAAKQVLDEVIHGQIGAMKGPIGGGGE